MKKHILNFTVLLLALTGCNYSHIKGGVGGDVGDLSVCAPTDFKTVFEQVIGPRCLNCHRPERAEKGVLLNTFANVEANIKKLEAEVFADNMPDGMPLDAPEKKFLLGWVAQGYKENISGVPAKSCEDVGQIPPDPRQPQEPEKLEANYDSLRKFVLDKNCLSCHNPKTKEKDSNGNPVADFSTFESMISRKEFFQGASPQDTRFIKALTTDDIFMLMPLFGSKLKDVEISTFAEWISLGLPRVKGGEPGLSPEDLNPVQEPPVQEPPIVIPPIVGPPIKPTEPSALPDCDELVVFETVRKEVFEPVCLNCHMFSKDHPFDSYQNVKDHIVKIRATVSAGTMPPPKKVTFDPKLKDLLLKWIDQGAAEKGDATTCTTP